MAGKVRHLLHARGRYSARVAVPTALREIIGKRELLEPLGADRTVALRKLPAAVAGMQALLDAARARASEAPTARTTAPRGRPLTIRQMARQHYLDQIQFDRELRETDHRYGYGFVDENEVAALRRAKIGKASDDELLAAVSPILEKFRRLGHTALTPESPDFRKTAMALAVAEYESLAVTVARDEGQDDAATEHPLLQDDEPLQPVPASPRIVGPHSTKPLRDILPMMTEEKGSRPGTVNEYKVSVRMFEEYLGEPRPAFAITRQDVLGYKRALMEAPSNYTKRFPGASLPEAIKRNKERATPHAVLSAKTINDKWLTHLRALFNWCVANDVMPDNPATGIKVDQVKATGAPRVPFAPGDLVKIFSSDRFGNSSNFGEKEWMTLIALFTGFRASEIAQIKLDSVRHERGIFVIAVEEETKNKGSVRLTPIHSTIVRLGFESRVAALRKAGESHLFPDWYRVSRAHAAKAEAREINQPFSQFLPRWFNRTYLPSVGIVDERKVFHSFRHTLKTALARAGVPRSVSDEITGHDDRTSGARYVHETSVEAMKEAIEKIQLDGFDL